MWQVDFKKHGDSNPGSLISSGQGSSEFTVICLLDPPRNAMPAEGYREAQKNMGKVYAAIPAHDRFVVGLQEDFWQEADKQALGRNDRELPETYLDGNGLGIVYAFSKVESKPPIVRLEDESIQRDYVSLSSRAIAFMSESAGFFLAITTAIRKARNQYFSPPLKKLERLSNDYQQSAISLVGYIRALREFANSSNIDLKSPRYQTISLFDQTAVLEETTVNEKEAQDVRNQLALDINDVAMRGKLTPRATWELYRYTLSNRFSEVKEAEAEVVTLDAMLRETNVPESYPEVTEKAIALVKERSLIDMRMVREGEDKADLLGDHGDAISNLMELGIILGLDILDYPVLTDYIHHNFLQTRLKLRSSGSNPAEALLQALLELEEEVTRNLAQTDAEKTLVEFKQVASFLESLGRFHLVYNEDFRNTIMNLSILETCESLAHLGYSVAANWRATALSLDTRFEAVRDLYDLSILRAKDMARGLLSAMKENGVTRGLLYCDGYMREVLERWFKGHEISYSFVIPDFRVPRL